MHSMLHQWYSIGSIAAIIPSIHTSMVPSHCINGIPLFLCCYHSFHWYSISSFMLHQYQWYSIGSFVLIESLLFLPFHWVSQIHSISFEIKLNAVFDFFQHLCNSMNYIIPSIPYGIQWNVIVPFQPFYNSMTLYKWH